MMPSVHASRCITWLLQLSHVGTGTSWSAEQLCSTPYTSNIQSPFSQLALRDPAAAGGVVNDGFQLILSCCFWTYLGPSLHYFSMLCDAHVLQETCKQC